MANGNGKPAEAAPRAVPALDDHGKANAAKADAAIDAGKQTERVTDPLQPRPGLTPAQAMATSPAHLLQPDPLPALNRPIFEAPRAAATHTMHLHPMQGGPVVEAAIEELRVRLGELREFFKRFPHSVGGELGSLVDHLRVALGVARPDPVRDADRRTEDAHIAARRRQEDLASGGAINPALLAARAREDADLAEFRRIQDTPVA